MTEAQRLDLIKKVAKRVHDQRYRGTSAACTICLDFAAAAVDAVLAELGANADQAPAYYPARTPKMRQVYLGSCGHVVFDAGQPESGHCYQCDPSYQQPDTDVTWQKLYSRRAAETAGAR